MTRRKQRAYGRDGLFEFVPGGIADVPNDNPLTRPCPKPRGCGVPAGQRCRRQVPRLGWVDLKDGYHDARTSNEVPKQEPPQVRPTSNEVPKVKPRHLNPVPIDRGHP